MQRHGHDTYIQQDNLYRWTQPLLFPEAVTITRSNKLLLGYKETKWHEILLPQLNL